MRKYSSILSSFLLVVFALTIAHNIIPHTHNPTHSEDTRPTNHHHHDESGHHHHQGHTDKENSNKEGWLHLLMGNHTEALGSKPHFYFDIPGSHNTPSFAPLSIDNNLFSCYKHSIKLPEEARTFTGIVDSGISNPFLSAYHCLRGPPSNGLV